MIVMGYPGIGKSTLAKENNERIIDLESSYFSKDYEQYVKVACDLESQGYIVFVSSHVEVGEELKRACKSNPNLIVGVCYPVRDIKDEWIKKLKLRYQETKLDKNKRAADHCEEYYTPDIWYIEEGGYPDFVLIPIKSMKYAFYVDDAYDFKNKCKKLSLKVENFNEENLNESNSTK